MRRLVPIALILALLAGCDGKGPEPGPKPANAPGAPQPGKTGPGAPKPGKTGN